MAPLRLAFPLELDRSNEPAANELFAIVRMSTPDGHHLPSLEYQDGSFQRLLRYLDGC